MIALRLDQRLGGRVSPSDVLQETYVDAMKRVPHFFANPDMPFFIWLRWIAGQRLVEVHRQHLGAQMRDAGLEVSLQRRYPAAASSTCLAAQLVGSLSSPSRAAIRGETLQQLEAALERLDPIDREILALRYFDGLSFAQIGAILGLKENTANARALRAAVKFRRLIPAPFRPHGASPP
jgi:RNA polymerase sigma-70 factor (ECF subfamily)